MKAASLDMAFLLKQAVTEAVTGAKHGLDMICEDFTVQYSWVTTEDKAVDALVFAFQGSLDGTSWFALATETADATELTNKCGMFQVTGKPVAYLRVDVTTLTLSGAAGTVTLTIKVASM